MESDNLLGYAISSHYREDVLTALLDGQKTPKEIAEAKDNRLSHTSRALKELTERDLTELLVAENTKKGRLYGLTGQGVEIARQLQERQA